MSPNNSIFVKCKCQCSVLEIEHDAEDDEFNITIWSSHSKRQPLSKKERIRWCEHIMKTGKPWADYTIVSNADAQRIVKHINNKLNKSKNGKAK